MTLEDSLAAMIRNIDKHFKGTGAKDKASPLKRLWQDGMLTVPVIRDELQLITSKKSTLSAGKRDAIVSLVMASARLADAKDLKMNE